MTETKIDKLKKELEDSNRKKGFYSHKVVEQLIQEYDKMLETKKELVLAK